MIDHDITPPIACRLVVCRPRSWRTACLYHNVPVDVADLPFVERAWRRGTPRDACHERFS